MLRLFDLVLSIFGLFLFSPLLIIVYICLLFDTGSPIFRQERLGRNKRVFTLLKFRTMKIGTESVASHLVSASSITPLGFFLRKTKLDELPQLVNVLRGEMSLVGPRPNLLNQNELILAREKIDAYNVRPGITGLAQVNGVDMSDPAKLAEVDCKMIKMLSFNNYFKYIFMTLIGSGQGDRIKN